MLSFRNHDFITKRRGNTQLFISSGLHKKSSITLIEVLIALFLIAMLVSSLLYAYRQVILLEMSHKENKNIMMSKTHTYLYLKNNFSHLCMDENREDRFFYTQENSLFFTFNNGIDEDPLFSSCVAGSLYVDAQNNLIFDISPLECLIEPPHRKIKLDTQVTELTIEFFKINHKESTTSKSFLWDSSLKELPHSMKIYVTRLQNGKPQTTIYPFILCP